MADDLLVGIGVDVSEFRRDRATILSEAQGLQQDIRRTLTGTPFLPDLGAEARTAGESVIAGLREAIQSGGQEIRRDVATALLPQSLASDVQTMRTTVRSGISGIADDFAAAGTGSGDAFLSALQRSLSSGAQETVTTFAHAVQASFSGTALLGDLRPIGERAGADLSAGVQVVLRRETNALRAAVSTAIVPEGLSQEIGKLESSVAGSLSRFPLVFGEAGRDAGTALVDGLTARLTAGTQIIQGFATETSRALTTALTIGDTGATGERAGRLLADSVATGIEAESQRVRGALAGALTPTSLTTGLTKLTSAVLTEVTALEPEMARQGALSGDAYIRAVTGAVADGATLLKRLASGALQGTRLLPDVSGEARTAGQEIVQGLQQGVESGAEALRRDVVAALLPRSLSTDVEGLRTTVRSGISGISNDFAAEGTESSIAFVSSLQRGLSDVQAIFSGFSRQVTTALTGTRGILGDLTPQAEAAGRDLVAGLTTAVRSQSGQIQRVIARAFIPAGLNTSFQPLLNAAGEAADGIVATLGRAGTLSGRALTSGLTEGLSSADAAIARFATEASTTIERAQLLSGLEAQGTRGGALLVSGVTRAITAGAGEIQRAVVTALVPTSLPTELRALTSAVAAESARLVPILSETGTEAGRGFTTSLTEELSRGTGTAVAVFTRGAQTAIAGTNLLGNLTPVGERAGVELSTGVQVALRREAVSLRGVVADAIVPTNITASLSRLEGTVTSALNRFPILFAGIGDESGAALITGLTARLSSGTQALAAFARETSQALTAALTIGDVSSTGERAGRLLAASVATGIEAEASTVRAALGAALAPAQLTSGIQEITATVATELGTLAPQFAREGAKDGEAYIGAIEGVVAQGAASLKQLTAGATVGVVVDVAPIRAATTAQQELTQATEATASSARELASTIGSLNTRPLSDAAEVAELLAEAEARAAANAKSGAAAFIDAWQQEQTAAKQAAGAAQAQADQAQQSAQAEVSAREKVRAAVLQDIAGLKEYAATISATNAEAVGSFEKQAAAIQENARAVGLEGEAIFKLDGFIRRTADAFRLQAAEARNAARAIAEQQVAPRTNVTGIAGDLAGISRQATAARTALSGVTIAGRSMQQITTRLGPALVGVGFGLEALARGGSAAEGGVRTALRAVASFAAFFGPEGFVVSGVAAALSGIIDLFTESRKQIEETRKKFDDEIAHMVESADVTGLQKQLQKLQVGSIQIDDQGVARFKGGLVDLQQQVDTLKDDIKAAFGRGDLFSPKGVNALQRQLDTLEPTLAERQREFERLANTIKNLPTLPRELTGAKPIKITASVPDSAKEIKALADQVNVVRDAFARVNGNAALQNAIIAKALPLYDAIARLSKAQGNNVSDTANDLARMLKTLGAIDTVTIELERRKLGGVVPDAEKAKIEGTFVVDKIEVPKTPEFLTVPVGLDEKVFQDSVKAATANLAGAQNREIFAQIFGSKQQVAEATRDVNIELGNTKRAFESAIAAELASADADDVKLRRIRDYIAAAHEQGVQIGKTAREAESLADHLNDVANAFGGIADAANEMGLFGQATRQAIDDAAQLAGAVARVADAAKELKDSGGIFGSVGNFIKAIPALGSLIASGVNLFKDATSAIFGADTNTEGQQIINDNIRAIQANTLELKHFGDTIGDKLGVSNALKASGILDVVKALTGTRQFATAGITNADAFDRLLRGAGSSLAELQKIAAQNGIQLLDSKGRISAKSLELLNESIQQTVRDLTTFSGSLSDQSFIADARRQIFDVDGDINKVLQDNLDLFRKFAPELFDRFLKGADVGSADGRKVIEEGIRKIFELAATNQIDPSIIKAFGSIEDFVNFLVGVDNALDQFSDTAKDANKALGEMINVATGFAVSNRAFKAISQGLNANNTFIPPTPPRPVPLPTGGGDTGRVAVTVSVGNVTVPGPQPTKEQVYQSIRRQALDKATSLGPAYRDAVEAALPA